ncbi:MAG TPA: hypothetical protein VFT60_10050 [Bryobacteraceae bacterium]|jgi:hypothetical protein|nr:hypothetical protein [Bryobacteraceae bacterium]
MTPTSQLSFPDENEVVRIAAVTDAADRNTLITAGYWKLSLEAERRMRGHANWCTYAAWASRQAGVTIRHRDLVNVLRDRIHCALQASGVAESLLKPAEECGLDVLQMVVDAIDELGPLKRSSEAVGEGNRQVFGDIALIFSRWLTMFPDIASISGADLQRFDDQLRLGPPPIGQELLRQAFTNYRAAARTTGAGERAQLMLLANVQVAFHEQLRLQPLMQAALDGALLEPGDVADFLHEKLTGQEGRIGALMRGLWGAVDSPARRLSEALARHIQEQVRILITENLMSIWLPPDQELRLGRDLTRPFPEALRTLTDPALVNLLAQFQGEPDSEEQSAVKDWADIKDRMGFIACLFRAYIDDRNLYDSPLAQK